MSKLLDMLASKEGLEKSEMFDRYFRQKAWEKGIPLMGSFELTPRCTLDCKMCYVHLNDHQFDHDDELTTEQWISLIDEACEAGMMYATLTGGECLLYPGFKKIYEHLQSRGILITILTNGTLLDEETVAWIAERSPQRVQISVYGSSTTGYKTVTGSAGAFHKVDRAIDLIKKSGIPFNIAITVSKQMVKDFEAILRYCRSKEPLSCNINSCPFESREETGRKFENYAPTLDEQVEIFRIQNKLRDDTFQDNSCDRQAIEKGIDEKDRSSCPEKGITCLAGRNSFSINWEGKMLPCNVFDFAGSYPLADGFLHSWQSMNRKCMEYLNPIECIGCEYYRACRFCPAGHYVRMGQGHANPNVCAEGRRMVAEKMRFL